MSSPVPVVSPAPTSTGSPPKRIVLAGMHSPAMGWLTNAILVLLEQQGCTPLWAGWQHELPDTGLPEGYSLIRVHEFDKSLADQADCIIFCPRDPRDALVGMHRSFGLNLDAEAAAYIMDLAQKWGAWTTLNLSYEKIVADPTAALQALARTLRAPTPHVAEIVAALQPTLDAVGEQADANKHVPAKIFLEVLSAELTDELTSRYGAWLSRNGYNCLTGDERLNVILQKLNSGSGLDSYFSPAEPKQRFDVRGAVRYLTEALREFGDLQAQLKAIARLSRVSPPSRPLLVKWAELLEEAGDRPAAAAKARESLSLYYDDQYTQKLFVRCAGEKDYHVDAQDRFCPHPFENFEIYKDGSVFPCNCTQVPFPIGNAHTQSADEIWQSPAARAIRESILDGSFKYCSPMTCWQRANLPKKSEHPEQWARLQRIGTSGAEPPKHLNLSYDLSCNLSCPSCRNAPIMASQVERKQLERVRDHIVLPLLANPQAESAYITGSGDAFGSPHFRGILRELCDPKYSHVQITLGTNGQLITPRLWQEFEPLHARFRDITISIDGATPETYERLRRGSTWEKLQTSMGILANARRTGVIRRLMVNMVVQEQNFLDMRPMVSLCSDWAVDGIRFYRIRQWGNVVPTSFMDSDIANSLHPRHRELMSELAHPDFRNRIVDRYDMYALIEIAQAAAGNPLRR